MFEKSRNVAASLPLAYRVVGMQAAVLVAVGIGLAIHDGAVMSFFAGGLCALIPNAWMAWRVNRRVAREASRDAIGDVLAIVEKLALVVGLLAFSLSRLDDLNAPVFFAGFILVLATHHAALVLDAGHGREI